jgi:hypothetical protein
MNYATYELKLTAKQLSALFVAIESYQESLYGYTQEELEDYGINKNLSALRQVETKLDKLKEKAGN